jgi:DNA polymerase IV
MSRTILHIDFNSYFATVEQQANPRLRGKPIGVTGGDRNSRTVLGAASVEAKKFGVKTGMPLWQARQLCPQIILVTGDSDKYLECTKRFLNILKDYTPFVEIFSIDECFLELPMEQRRAPIDVAKEIKSRIRSEIGSWITCSIGISYNRLMAKLAGSLQKPDGLITIPNQEEAIKVLDKIELDDICGIGFRIKNRLFNLGVTNFYQLRQVPLPSLLASFKSYGQVLYNMARGVDHSKLVPFYEKEEVKSVGHRHTINHDTNSPEEIKQLLLKLSELVARRLRSKKLTGKTVSLWYRDAFINFETRTYPDRPNFTGGGMQTTILSTDDGLDIFQAGWRIFNSIWDKGKIRMIGISISNLQSATPANLSWLPEDNRKEVITHTLDKINDRFGEFTLQRGTLLTSMNIKRKPNSFLSDRRFKL